jgi:hypothetical protein
MARLSDLRVFLDFDDDTSTFVAWPVDKLGRPLPADQIARGARLGLALWASVLPDMRFRFVDRPGEANVAFRFGQYLRGGFGDGGGRAFLPQDWSELAIDCGRVRESEWPDGRPCREWDHNIITFFIGRWAVSKADFVNFRRYGAYLEWVFDRRRPHHRVAGGPCRDGSDSAAAWDHTCTPFGDAPHFESFHGIDLAAIVMHEAGHAILGHHTPEPYSCVDYARRPVFIREKCIRLGPQGFSVMFPGDGVDGWWNRRGVFRADADRLRTMGYRVAYPEAAATLHLARPDGSRLVTRNWAEAEKAMLWTRRSTTLGEAETRRQYYLVDIVLDPPEARAARAAALEARKEYTAGGPP